MTATKDVIKFTIFMAIVVLIYVSFPKLMAKYLVVVSGDSMNPLYTNGDTLIVHPVKSVKDIPLDHPACHIMSPEGGHLIKRLIGYPGDLVELIDGHTYVNGELIMLRTTNCWDNMTLQCGDDEYLFLGDNREVSVDARLWGEPFLHLSDIISIVKNSGLKAEVTAE